MKGQGMSINVLVAAIIILFVGIVIIAVFISGAQGPFSLFQKQENCDAHNGKCIANDAACDGLIMSFKCQNSMRCCITNEPKT